MCVCVWKCACVVMHVCVCRCEYTHACGYGMCVYAFTRSFFVVLFSGLVCCDTYICLIVGLHCRMHCSGCVCVCVCSCCFLIYESAHMFVCVYCCFAYTFMLVSALLFSYMFVCVCMHVFYYLFICMSFILCVFVWMFCLFIYSFF